MSKAFVILLLIALTACSSSRHESVSGEDCWTYIRKAIDLRGSGKYNESLAEIEKHGACDKSEIRMSYFYHKGWTYHEMGEYQNAVDAFSRGLETQPDYFYAHWRRGLSYEALGDTVQAQKNYRLGYEVGVNEHGNKFFEYMDKNPEVKKNLVQDWDI